MSVQIEASSRCFGGEQLTVSHASSSTGTQMRFSCYVPEVASGERLPVLYYLSGLTCTEENFTVKSGFQRTAAEHKLLVVAPDTSPREGAPDHENPYLGYGAGFYLNASQVPWSAHYRMYDYIVDELPQVVADNFPVLLEGGAPVQSVMGHSMGGHGALLVGVRNPDRYRSVSALAPIASLCAAPWGRAALELYLGADERAWEAFDVCASVRRCGYAGPLWVETGTEDPFLDQLQPERLRETLESCGIAHTWGMREGYDHSYFFVASVMGEHMAWHRRHLSAEAV